MNPIPISGDLSANLVFAAVASSLIPAFVIKLLMGFFFQRSVGFLKLAAAMVLSVFLAFGIAYAMGLQSRDALNALSQNTTLAITAATMLLQAVVLFIVVTDDIGQRVPLWQWIVALILQYVLFAAFAYLLVIARSL